MFQERIRENNQLLTARSMIAKASPLPLLLVEAAQALWEDCHLWRLPAAEAGSPASGDVVHLGKSEDGACSPAASPCCSEVFGEVHNTMFYGNDDSGESLFFNTMASFGNNLFIIIWFLVIKKIILYKAFLFWFGECVFFKYVTRC